MAMKARRIMIGAGGVLLLLIAAAYLYVRSITPQLELGTGYAARVACACRYIGNRKIENCRADFEPGNGVNLAFRRSVDEDGNGLGAADRQPLGAL